MKQFDLFESQSHQRSLGLQFESVSTTVTDLRGRHADKFDIECAETGRAITGADRERLTAVLKAHPRAQYPRINVSCYTNGHLSAVHPADHAIELLSLPIADETSEYLKSLNC